MAFANLEQATAEDLPTVTNLMTANITLTEQVGLYTNCFSTKEADKMAMQTTMMNLQGELKNLKA